MPCIVVAVLAYLILNQHGDIDKHIMKLFDAAFQPHDVLVASFDLIQGLLVDLGLHDLGREGVDREREVRAGTRKHYRELTAPVEVP